MSEQTKPNTREIVEMIKSHLNSSAEVKRRIAEALSVKIAEAATLITECFRSGGKVVLLGNGGSAADAQHIAGELLNRFKIDRRPLPAIALHTDTSTLTAISNDSGYQDTFKKGIEAHGQAGDVAIAITTSDGELKPDGHSANIAYALKAAKDKGLNTIGLVSIKTKDILTYFDVAIQVPSEETPRIQEGQELVYHILCELVEKELFKE